MCDFKEKIDATDNPDSCLIYRNDLKGGKEQQVFDSNLIRDPTMQKTSFKNKSDCCAECGHNEAIFFRSPDYEDKYLKLTFICTRVDKNGNPLCGNMWYTKPKEEKLKAKEEV